MEVTDENRFIAALWLYEAPLRFAVCLPGRANRDMRGVSLA